MTFKDGGGDEIIDSAGLYSTIVGMLTHYDDIDRMPADNVVELSHTIYISKYEFQRLMVEVSKELMYFPHIMPVDPLNRLAMRWLLECAYISSDEETPDTLVKEEIKQIEAMIERDGFYEEAGIRLSRLTRICPNSVELHRLRTHLDIYEMFKRSENE